MKDRPKKNPDDVTGTVLLAVGISAAAVLGCGSPVEQEVARSADRSALDIRTVWTAESPCTRCIEFDVPTRWGALVVLAEPELLVSVPLDAQNVYAIVVDSDGEKVWKASVLLEEETASTIRKAGTVGKTDLVVTRQSRGLGLLRSPSAGAQIVFGTFLSKHDLEDQLGIASAIEVPIEFARSARLEETERSLKAAESVIARQSLQRRVLAEVERALEAGDRRLAEELMQSFRAPRDAPE